MSLKEWWIKMKDCFTIDQEDSKPTKEVWWILHYNAYIDTSYNTRVDSIAYTAASSKKGYINTHVYGRSLTKEKVLWCLNNGIKIKGRFE